MTMPRSSIMEESTERKSLPQLESESLVSTMAIDIRLEKEKEREDSPPLGRTIVQSDIDFDRRCEEASAKEKESIKWPSSMVYGITSQQVQQRKVLNIIERLLPFWTIMELVLR